MIDFTKIPCISAKCNGKLTLGEVKHKNKNSFERGFSYKEKPRFVSWKFSPAYDKIQFLLKRCIFSWRAEVDLIVLLFFLKIVSDILNSIHVEKMHLVYRKCWNYSEVEKEMIKIKKQPVTTDFLC